MPNTFVFEVNLTDRNGNPMIGVEVEAVDTNLFTVAAPDPMHYVVQLATTDISGTATFPALPVGSYFARPRITHREDMRIQVTQPSGMGGGGKMCYAALVEKHGLGTHTTIQSAITALGLTGGVIYICGGTYTEDLTIAEHTVDLWLLGASRSQCIIVGNLIAGHGLTNFRMEHLTIDGDAGIALLFNSGAGIGIPATIVLSDLTITHATVGMDFSAGTGFTDVTIVNVDMTATVTFAGQFEVMALDISDCRWLVGKGPCLGGGAAIVDTKISNSTFWGGADYAMQLWNCTTLIISGCRFQAFGAGTPGIKVVGTDAHCVISSCIIAVQDGKGIDASSAVGLSGFTLEGIQLSCGSPNTARIGIDLDCFSEELIITGCRIKLFKSYGIRVGATGATYTQNYIISDTVIVNGNDCHSIYLRGSDYGNVIGCVLIGRHDLGVGVTYGIYGAAGTTWTIVEGNTVYNHDDTTNLVNGTDNNVVGGNNPTGAGGAVFHNPVTLDAGVGAVLDITAGQLLSLDLQAANLVFSGPTAGVPATPAFRSLVDLDIPAAIMRDAEHTAIGDGAPHHPAITLGGGSDAALSLAAGQVLTLADVLTPAEHTAIGDAAPHHAAITLGGGSDPALALAGQQLTLADVLTPAEHTAIGNAAPHHAPITIHADLNTNLLALAAQELDLDTQVANLVFAGPAAAGPSKPTFRSMVAADLPAEAIVDADFAAAEGFMRKTGAGTYVAHKSNLASAANPGVNDDAAAGYSVGSVWINTTLDVVWQCVDSTNGNAVWKDLSTAGGGGGGSSIQDADADTKIQTEEAADEDKIRFDTAGVERAVLDNVALDLAVPLKVDTINEHTGATGVLIENVRCRDSYIDLAGIVAPAAPPGNAIRLYSKIVVGPASQLWFLNDAGLDTQITGYQRDIQDTDFDTGINVEEAPDDDTVRIDLGGGAPVADAVVMTAAGGLISKINIIPNTDSAIDLGSSAPKYFANAYVDKYWLNATAALDGSVAGKAILTGAIRAAASPAALLEDSGGTARLTIGTASPNVLLTGVVKTSGTLSIYGSTPATNIFFRCNPTATFAGFSTGLQVSPTITDSVDNPTAAAMTGSMILKLTGGPVVGSPKGIGFTLTTQDDGATAVLLTNQSAIRATCNVFDMGATCTVTSLYGLYLSTPGISGTVITYDAIYVQDETVSTNVRLLELGGTGLVGGVPYFRVVGKANPAANQTNIYMMEGAGNLRQVQWKNPDATGHMAAADKVMVLV